MKIPNSTQIWTSALASPSCPNTMGWCDEFEKEFVDLKAIGVQTLDFSGKKECLAVTLQQTGNSSNFTFLTDECRLKRRALCEEVNFI
jgi:hypothetical protein